jgi:AraC family transcriptional regulator, positive regulator of tynA and feaB
MMMHQSWDCVRTHQVEFEAWAAVLPSTCGGVPKVKEPDAFAGWMRRLSVHGVTAAALRIHCGFAASDHGRSAYRYERTQRDARIAGVDGYWALYQLASRCAVIQNDQVVELMVGDIALVDGARPATYVSENGSAQWLSLYLPRQSLISHLGFEPLGTLRGRGATPAGRALRQLLLDGIEDEESISGVSGPYMRLALYDLFGALFARSVA